MGEDRDTKPASAKPTDITEASPISSGDFPSVDPSRIDMHSTKNRPAMPPPVPVSNLPARRKIGKYSLIKEIGRGGMGVVYHAHQGDLNRDVALKVIPSGPDADQTEVARFQAEAETAANLHHPNIVPVYDVGSTDGLSYLAMELIEGGSLYKLIDHQPIDPVLAARLLEAVARAMHYAHTQGVIHRDLKPSNILLAKPEAGARRTDRTPNEDLIPKITDFGLAKRIDRPLALTQTGLAVGTPHYMAPEQALGKSDQISPLTDVYALGAILYEMLTGHPPFGANSSLETMQQVVTRKPMPPSSLRASVPRELEHICLKCLEKKPHNRFESALAVADALHHFLHRTEPPTILAQTAMESESSVSLFVLRTDAWYFWPAVALLASILTAVVTWRITDLVATRTQNAVRESLNESENAVRKSLKESEAKNASAQFEAANLLAEKAVLLADRGDFESINSIEFDGEPGLVSVIAEYRKQHLTQMEWKIPPAELVAFAGDRSLLASFRANQLSFVDLTNNKSTIKANSVLAFGRSKITGLVAFVDDKGQLHAEHEVNDEPRIIQRGLIGKSLLVQPLADKKKVGLTDGTNRWIINTEGDSSGKLIPLAKEPDTKSVLAISEQGDWLFEGTTGWRVVYAMDGPPPRVIPAPGVYPAAIALFSPTRSHLLAVLPNGSGKLFDFNDDRWLDLPADGYINNASFSSDGNVLVVGTGAGTVRLWDVHSRTRLSGSASLKKSILSADINNRQTKIVAVTDGDNVLHGFSNPARPFAGPAIRLENKPFRDIVDIAFSSSGESLYVTTPRGLSRWKIETGTRDKFTVNEELTPAQLLPSSPGSEYKSMSVNSPTAKAVSDQVLVGADGGKIAVVAFNPNGTFSRKESSIPEGTSVTGIAHSKNGERTVAVGETKNKGAFLRYWSSASGLSSDSHVTKSFNFKVTSECFDLAGEKIFLGCEDGTIRIWNPDNDATVTERKFDCESRVICIALSTDGKRLLAGCADGNAIVFEIATGKRVRTLKHRTEVRKVAFDRERPITAAADGAIRVWHESIDFTLGPPFRHADAITALSIRNKLFASASRDRTIRVWRLPE